MVHDRVSVRFGDIHLAQRPHQVRVFGLNYEDSVCSIIGDFEKRNKLIFRFIYHVREWTSTDLGTRMAFDKVVRSETMLYKCADKR